MDITDVLSITLTGGEDRHSLFLVRSQRQYENIQQEVQQVL